MSGPADTVAGWWAPHFTGRDGFRLRARPQAEFLRVEMPVGRRRLLPVRPSADVRLEVRPEVSLSASATVATSGTEVLFTGRLQPAPGDMGRRIAKGIVLEWLDPVRTSWRPVVNARIPPRWHLLGAVAVRMPRPEHPGVWVVVPAEVGWPLLPARYRVIRVRLG